MVKIRQILIVIVFVLLFSSSGIFLYRYFYLDGEHTFKIENKYYAFELKTPKIWSAYENTEYSEEKIASILEKCKTDTSAGNSLYEIGQFRFESQKYSQEAIDLGNFSAETPSGVILEIRIECLDGDKIQHEVNPYVYISSQDKFHEESLRENYAVVINKIISSIKFKND